jgi:hypothetical protein
VLVTTLGWDYRLVDGPKCGFSQRREDRKENKNTGYAGCREGCSARCKLKMKGAEGT